MRAVPFMFEFEVHTRFLVVLPQQTPRSSAVIF